MTSLEGCAYHGLVQAIPRSVGTAPQVAGQLRQGKPGGLDVIAGRAGAGVPGPEHEGQRLAGTFRVCGELERLAPPRLQLMTLLLTRNHIRHRIAGKLRPIVHGHARPLLRACKWWSSAPTWQSVRDVA